MDSGVKDDERWWARFSLGRVIFWIIVTGLAYFYNWLASVSFVALCSLYANIGSDFAAWRADRNRQILRIEAKLDKLLEAIDANQNK